MKNLYLFDIASLKSADLLSQFEKSRSIGAFSSMNGFCSTILKVQIYKALVCSEKSAALALALSQKSYAPAQIFQDLALWLALKTF